ncbi:LamG-like jellyroll fold domain-containing protein [Dyadobacter sp. 32]|uniref:LamG-like jellyroll fold domain-containing protein n=1 Tax=Dyadobacter sp. 32 TaxID=538966 RepID=UPI0011EDB61A
MKKPLLYLLPGIECKATHTIISFYVICGALLLLAQAGKAQFNQAIALNGINQYCNFAAGQVVDKEFTVEAWVRPDATAGRTMTIISSRYGTGKEYSFDLKLVNGTSIQANIGDGTSWIKEGANATFKYEANRWYHIGYTVSASANKYVVYVNGREVGSGSLVASGSSNPVLFDGNHYLANIGKNESNGSDWFFGLIDDVKVENYALPANMMQYQPYGGILDFSNRAFFYFDNADVPNGRFQDATHNFYCYYHGSAIFTSNSYASVVCEANAATGIGTKSFTANWTRSSFGVITNYLVDVATDVDFNNKIVTAQSVNEGTTSLTIGGLSPLNQYYYRVRANNTEASLNNTGAYSNTVSVSTYGVPTINSFTPGSTGTGNTVTIIGTNFTSDATVKFGGTNATAVVFNGTNSLTATVSSGSDGNITVTTPAGTATSGTSFTFLAAPSVTGTTLICNGSSTTLTAAGVSGAAFAWYDATTAGNLLASTAAYTTPALTAATHYYVQQTLSDGASTRTDVLVQVLQNPSVPTITATGATNFCAGSSVKLSAPAGANSYLWKLNGNPISDGATSQSITITTAGSYTITVTNANGCANTSAATVVTVNALPAVPTISANKALALCNGDNIALTASSSAGGSICATASEGGTLSIQAPANAHFTGVVFASYGTPSGSCGSYSTSSCHAANSVSVVSPYIIGNTSVDIPVNNTVFGGDPCNLTTKMLVVEAQYTYDNPPISFTWSTAATTAAITVSPAVNTSYTVTANLNGCTNTSAATVVTLNAVTAITSSPTGQTVCTGSNASFTVAATGVNLSYQWEKNGTNVGNNASTLSLTNLTATDAGSYTCVVTGTCGSATTTAATLTINTPTLGNYTNNTVVAGQNTSFTPGAIPTNTTSLVASTSSNFTGVLSADPATGVVQVTDAKPAGIYTITVKATNNGSCTAATTSFALTVTNPACSEINLTGSGVSIPDGKSVPSTADLTDFGTTCSSSAITKTFTIETTGTLPLLLNSGAITMAGTDASMFTVGGIVLPISIAGGSSTTFTVTFAPGSAIGAKTATVHIASDDCDEADYDFAILATANALPTMAINGDATTTLISGSTMLTATSSICRVVANILPITPAPVSGNVTARVWVDATQHSNYVKRHYQITPVTADGVTPADYAGTATGKVTLYFTQQEFDDFNGASSTQLPKNPTDIEGNIPNLRIEKRSGTSSDGSGLPNTYPAVTPETFKPVDKNGSVVWNGTAARWEVSFEVTGFSGFFVKTAGTALPLRLISFTGTQESTTNNLKWETADEVNTKSFELESSRDGRHFLKVVAIPAISTGNNSYDYTDRTIYKGIMYYRLKMIDVDGTFTYSRILTLSRDGKGGINLFPNPVTDLLNLSLDSDLINSEAKLYDTGGRLLQTIKIASSEQLLNVKKLPTGIYIIKFRDGSSKSFVKE